MNVHHVKQSMSNSVSDAYSLKKPPVVAFVIEELSVGGAEHMLTVMANEFVDRGWHVHMICLAQAGELATLLNESISLHVLNKQRGIDLRLPGRFARCVEEIQPDIINSHLWVANAWTRIALLRTSWPVVVTEHSRDSWKPVHYRWIDQMLAGRARQMVTVSEDTASFYKNSIGIDAQMITVIHNGVDAKQYAAGCGHGVKQAWLELDLTLNDTERDLFLIGTVGRLVKAKNHRRLIDACARLINDTELASRFDIRLKIVGEGPERSRLQHYIDELGLGHSMTLAGARHDIPDVLAAFDVFVLSSDREGHPLTALEAQAAGTPVILTDVGGASEAIAREGERSGGLLVQPCVDALTDALRETIAKPEALAQRAAFAQQYALENFDKTQMIERYEAVFLSAMLEQPAP